MLARMRELEEVDAKDRTNGTPHQKRLRQVPPEVGQFIAILAAAAPDGPCIEIGTSAGYSTLWLVLACRERNRKIITFEILDEKANLAQATFDSAAVNETVELIRGDALAHLKDYKDITFCFLDAEKDIYERCYEEVVPRMMRGGILVADNAIDHRAVLQPMLDRALSDERMDSLIVPIGNGELVCRKK